MYIIYAKYTYSVRVLYKLGAHYCGSFYGEQTHQLAWKNLGTRQKIHISMSFELFWTTFSRCKCFEGGWQLKKSPTRKILKHWLPKSPNMGFLEDWSSFHFGLMFRLFTPQKSNMSLPPIAMSKGSRYLFQPIILGTLPETNSQSPWKLGPNAPKGNEKVLQPSIFRC